MNDHHSSFAESCDQIAGLLVIEHGFPNGQANGLDEPVEKRTIDPPF
jgi:hypothetical protein